MNREDWIKFIESNPSLDTFIVKYCTYKGKPEALSRVFYMVTLDTYGVSKVLYLKEVALKEIKEEFNLIEITDKEGNFIKIY